MVPVSELIALGRTLLRPISRTRRFGSDSGCALGMAEAAVGLKPAVLSKSKNIQRDIEQLEKLYPWLKEEWLPYPCSCSSGTEQPNRIIEHLFDRHVCQDFISLHLSFAQGIKFNASSPFSPWTMEQLIDWVKSVEPKEPAVEELELDRTLVDVLHSR